MTEIDPFDYTGMTKDFITRSIEGYHEMSKVSQKEFLRQMLAYHTFFEQLESNSKSWGVGITEFFDKINKMRELFK